MQLTRGLSLAAALATAAVAPARVAADGTVTLRGAYYKERATRVVQPMLDVEGDVTEHDRITAHVAVDAITSASAATGADGLAFTERRYETGVGFTHAFARWRLGGAVRYSSEPDYKSMFGSARVEVDFAEKNFIVGATLGGGRDSLSNAGQQSPFAPVITGELSTALGSVSATQLLGPRALVAVTYDLAYQSGFLENAYRLVFTGTGPVAERHPDTRLRHAVALSGRRFVAPTKTTLIGSYRLYVDDWGLVGHTPEVRVVQDASDTVDVAVRYRFHWQSAADFFEPRYATGDATMFPYLTDDVKLSRFTSHTLEAKLGVRGLAFGLDGRWGEARLEGSLQYVDQNNRFGNAISAQAAVTVPFEE